MTVICLDARIEERDLVLKVFEFYALDTKLDLPANTTRDDLLKVMEGHVIGKAAYTGCFHTPPQ